MVATLSVGGVLAGMVLWLNYSAVDGNTISPVDVYRRLQCRLQYLQVVSNLFPSASHFICFPSGTPHEVSVGDVRNSMPILSTVIHRVSEDPQNCPVPLWWSNVKNRTDSPFRQNVFRVHAQDARYSGTGSPPNVGPSATLSQPVNQSVCLTAVLAVVRGTSLCLGQPVVGWYEIMNNHKPGRFKFLR